MAKVLTGFRIEGSALPEHVRHWLLQQIERKLSPGSDTISVGTESSPVNLELSFISQIRSDEIEFRFFAVVRPMPDQKYKQYVVGVELCFQRCKGTFHVLGGRVL